MDASDTSTRRELYAAMVETAIRHFFRWEELRTGETLSEERRQAITDTHVQKWLRKYDAAPPGEGE